MIEILKGGIAREGCVKINDFGRFNLSQKAARMGRNPFTGEELTRVLTFKVSSTLKAAINKG